MRIKAKGSLWIAVIFCLIFTLYQSYPFLLFKVMEWQRAFNQQLSGSLSALAENSRQAGITLIVISFLYGVFHAVGPGHGKFILTSYLSLEKTELRQAMNISLLSALVQGLVAVCLVSIIIVMFTLSRHYFNLTLKWIERGSFLLMILFGFYWCINAIRALRPKVKSIPKISRITAVNLQKNDKITPLVQPSLHIHAEHCGCGHQHLPSAEQMQRLNDWKSKWLIIMSIGARPCSGAILVLFLAYTLDLYWWGVLAALVMAIGTGMTLSLLAWLVLLARNKAIGLSSWYFSTQTNQYFSLGLRVCAGIALMILGMILFHSSFIDAVSNGGLLKR
ncbi:nickel/cobalt transporter [Actinobacillus arthritidis]|uniref:nickel/cobalt transporter n=1 Tax=Actinobacillus arthritidis TaxID=157339 RepID=UPI002441796D|nr:nickel/cobalt transporter [Actinobacillus arthritidis]WGE90058.1 nickel/cobalt transporter [Actinobacillus arthritidis]